SLGGNVRRAIDIHEGEEVDESAFKALVRQAVASTVLASRKLRRKRSPKGFRPRTGPTSRVAEVLFRPGVPTENRTLIVAALHIIPRVTSCAVPEESAFVFNIQAKNRFLASLGMTIAVLRRIHDSRH